jgi:hypothetical protein
MRFSLHGKIYAVQSEMYAVQRHLDAVQARDGAQRSPQHRQSFAIAGLPL